MPALAKLFLDHNLLTGEIPSELGNRATLTDLYALTPHVS
jgi:hypothetical protein